jgi:hypothetical protein
MWPGMKPVFGRFFMWPGKEEMKIEEKCVGRLRIKPMPKKLLTRQD